MCLLNVCSCSWTTFLLNWNALDAMSSGILTPRNGSLECNFSRAFNAALLLGARPPEAKTLAALL